MPSHPPSGVGTLARPYAPQGPAILATMGVALWALWLVAWLVALTLLRHDLFASQAGGVRTLRPSTADVAVSIVRHAGPPLVSGALLLTTVRCARAGRAWASWLVAILGCLVPAVLVVL